MTITAREIQEKQSAFYTIANFPSVIGTIYCTHVKIQSPDHLRSKFKSAECSSTLGSTHDSAIFTNSRVCQEFEAGKYGQALLLGDNGYPLKNYLITPYLNPWNPSQERFNKSLIKTRNTVERQYGVIERRFPALAMGFRIKAERDYNVIIACCILYNICVDFGENVPPTPDELDEDTLNRRIQDGQNVIIACCIPHNICVDFGENVPPIPYELDKDTLNRRIQDGEIENEILDLGLLPNTTDRRSLFTQNYFS